MKQIGYFGSFKYVLLNIDITALEWRYIFTIYTDKLDTDY